MPGRVEFVGKHVDYAGGRSLTCAIEAAIHATATPIAEPVLRVRDGRRRDVVTVQLAADRPARNSGRGAYAAAIARRLVRDFPGARRGVEVVLRSNLPASAGLSSSSALVVALAMALVDANDLDNDPAWRAAAPTPMARAEYFAAMETGAPYGTFAGDEGVGVRGGAQDHVAIVCSREGEVGQFRYLPPRVERFVPFPDECLIAIAVSGVHAAKRGNARTSYNRLSDAMRAFAISGVPDRPPPEVAERVAQFREETDVIVPGAAEALSDRDFDTLGSLVDRSQWLAEHVLGNQVRETIFLARAARENGALAASAFGAGFGGAVWALVRRDEAQRFVAGWRAQYENAFPSRSPRARWIVTGAAGPARRLS
ncbi:MAG TPA: galactokinase family protein [Gemmatimonadaceae bacterium]|nr:galactokinase family protein [Gemmatimonadaceae bacterium]